MKLEDFEFETRGPVIGEAEIAVLEKRLKVSLPNDYRAFLLKYNGGLSKLCVSEDPPLRIETWFSLCEYEQPPLILSLDKARSRVLSELGKDFLPIGEDVSNWGVFMCLSGPRKFGIGYLDPEKPGPPDIKISFKSFTDMLEHLQHSDDFV